MQNFQLGLLTRIDDIYIDWYTPGMKKNLASFGFALVLTLGHSMSASAGPHHGYLVMQDGHVSRFYQGLLLPLKGDSRLDSGAVLKPNGEFQSEGASRKLAEGQMIDWSGRDVGPKRAFIESFDSSFKSGKEAPAQKTGVIALVDGKPIFYSFYLLRVRLREQLENRRSKVVSLRITKHAIKQGILKEMVFDELLCAKAAGSHLTADGAEIERIVEEQPENRRVGAFDPNAYAVFLKRENIDREEYEYGLSRIITAQKVKEKLMHDTDSESKGLAAVNAYLNAAAARINIRTFPETSDDKE